MNIKKSTNLHKATIAFGMIFISVLIIVLAENTNLFNSSSVKYSNTPIIKDGFYFDTYISISIYDSKDNYSDNITSTEDINMLLDECMDMCMKYENIFSRTLESSELYMINHNQNFINGSVILMSDTLAECINKTLEYSMVFGEKYSILSGTLCDQWNYNESIIPDTTDIISNCIAIESNKLTVSDNKLKLSFDVAAFELASKKYSYSDIISNTEANTEINIPMPNLEINLGSSAKGYIANKLCQHLKNNGIKDAIIDLGGNIAVIGNKYDNSMYKIGIKKPFSGDNEPYAVCQVADMSVVTSGIYERYFEKDGNIYHHIIDCSTGYPADNDIISVTIITEDSLKADCYSTGCLLLGKDVALTLINDTEGVECIIIDDNYDIHLSQGLIYKNDYIVLK